MSIKVRKIQAGFSVMGLKIHFCKQCSWVLSFRPSTPSSHEGMQKCINTTPKQMILVALGDNDLHCTAFGKTFLRR